MEWTKSLHSGDKWQWQCWFQRRPTVWSGSKWNKTKSLHSGEEWHGWTSSRTRLQVGWLLTWMRQMWHCGDSSKLLVFYIDKQSGKTVRDRHRVICSKEYAAHMDYKIKLIKIVHSKRLGVMFYVYVELCFCLSFVGSHDVKSSCLWAPGASDPCHCTMGMNDYGWLHNTIWKSFNC